jgi:uncharacterized protein (DUF488 family)
MYSVGIEGVSSRQFMREMQENGIESVVDTREPSECASSELRPELLKRRLRRRKIRYCWMGDRLRGSEAGAEFRLALEDLCEMAIQKTICLLGREREAIGSHRVLALESFLQTRGFAFLHIPDFIGDLRLLRHEKAEKAKKEKKP